MIRFLRRAALGAALLAAPPASGRAAGFDYPATRALVVTDTLHGVAIADPYRWLEDAENPDVKAWTDAQNTFRQSLLARLPGREAIADRLEELYDAVTPSTPSPEGSRYFYTRRDGLQNHPVLYVREGSRDAPERVAIDPNTFSEDGTVAMDWWYPSSDGSSLAYGTSPRGTERSTLRIRDVATGKDLPESIPDAARASVAWDADGKGFYYTKNPAKGSVPPGDENYYRRVYHHALGADPAKDPVIFDDFDRGRAREELCSVYSSSDESHLFLNRSLDWVRNDLYVKPLAMVGDFRPVAVGLDGEVSADLRGNTLFIRTNWKAPRYRLLTADLANPDPAGWKEILPEQEGVIKEAKLVGDRLVVTVTENAHSRLFVHALDGTRLAEVPLPTLGTVGAIKALPEGNEFFFTFTSFAFPNAVFRYDLGAGALERIDGTRMKAAVDLSAFETKQVWFTSKDGTRVPMFLVGRKDLPLDGSNPTLLTGYGGFGVSETPAFRAGLLLWLERGGVYALPNLRGGGEFGREWHEAGRLGKKQNVYDDFIAAAEWLIASGYTNPKRLVIEGGSNGGLLVGAAEVQRPDLFQAVVCQVPLLDMLRYHLFSIARFWIPEYGSSENPEQFAWLRAGSPYHNVRTGTDYPATLLTAGESDTRVDPLHAKKMAALLQASTSGDRPILLRVESKAGHGQGMPLRKRLDGQTDQWTFVLWQLGMLGAPATGQLAPGATAPGR